MKKTNNKGFTLVELIIVIAILAIIMLIAIPNFSGIQQRMQVRADKSSAAQIGKAIRIWYTEYTSDAAFASAVTSNVGAATFDANGVMTVTTEGCLQKQDATNPKAVVPIKAIKKLDEYVDTDLTPDSLRTATNNIVETNQYYYAGIVGSGTAEKVVVCISDKNVPMIPAGTATVTVGYTGDNVASANDPANFSKTVAYLEP